MIVSVHNQNSKKPQAHHNWFLIVVGLHLGPSPPNHVSFCPKKLS